MRSFAACRRGIMEANGCICFQKNFWEVQMLTPACLWLDCSRKRTFSPAHQAECAPERKSRSKWRLRLDEAWERVECICCVEGTENRRGGCAAGKVLLSALKMGNHTGTDRASGETTCCFSISSSAPRNPPMNLRQCCGSQVVDYFQLCH